MFRRQGKLPKDPDSNVKIVDGRESRLVDPPRLQPPNGVSVAHSQQCVPELRDWGAGKNQKCDPCERNGKDCGPNILAPSSQTQFDLSHKSIGPSTAAQVPGEIGQFSNQPVTPANNGAINSFGLSPPFDYVNWNVDPGHAGPMNTSPAAPAAMNLTFQLPQDEAATQR
jgi:hypothetical protein